MIKLPPLVILAAFLLWSSLLNAQSVTDEFKSVSSGIRIQWHAPVTKDFELGTGFGVQWWAEAEFKPRLSLTTALGYHQFAGYQQGYVHYENFMHNNLPRERIQIIEINSLGFAAADIGISYSFGKSWSASWSTRVAHLHRAKTSSIDQTIEMRPDPDYSIYTYFPSFLIDDYLLRDFDLGMQVALRYEIIKGVQLEVGVYQGFINQWSSEFPGDEPLRVTSINLGVSARFF